MTTLLSFLIGAFQRVYVSLVGRLPVAELFYIVSAPVLLVTRPQVLRVRGARMTLFLGVLWLGSQMFSDLINGSLPEDYLRGWANIVMILLAFVTWMAIFQTNVSRNYVFYLVGLAMGGAYFVLSGQADPNVNEVWSNKVGPWSAPLVLILVWWSFARGRRHMATTFAFLYGISSVVFNARSHGMGFIVVGAVLLFVPTLTRFRNTVTRTLVAKYAAMGFVLVGIIFVTYTSLGLQGLLGTAAQEQLVVLRQPYNPLHVIFRARSEGLAASKAIIDKPVFGHGSWARDRRYIEYQYQLLESVTVAGTSIYRPDQEDDLIPAHSHVLQAWVYSGILGAIFWIFQLILFCQITIYFLKRPNHPAFPVVIYAMWAVGWNLLFSPFVFGRVAWPALCAFCLTCRAISDSQECHFRGRDCMD